VTDHTTTEAETPTPQPTVAEQLLSLIEQIVDEKVETAVDNLNILDDSDVERIAEDVCNGCIDDIEVEVEATVRR
jgi:hypothetical protein